jgi:enoyl-CoA hydratase
VTAGGQVVLRRRPGAVEVRFNRPEKHNALTERMYDALLALCAEVSADASVRVVLFRGEGGRAFSAGNDIASFLAVRDGADGVAYESRIREVLQAVADLPQVTVAVVEGLCVGGGLALATACDLRLCTPSSRFGYPIARTLGNALSAPVLARCVEVFGDSLTREMLLASRLVSPDRAYAAGAVMGVIEASDLEDEVGALLEGIGGAAPLTIEITKAQLREGREGYQPSRDERRLAAAYGSAEFHRRVRRFLSRRAVGTDGRKRSGP